ncbi:MAG: TolB family protein [Eubacteriales bacterium]
MKRKRLIICAVLLIIPAALMGCGKNQTDYYNRADHSNNWFTLGDVIYTGSVFSVRSQYYADFDSPLTGLCRDPLCTHDGNELCPDHIGFTMAKSYCTDGERIYFSGMNILTDSGRQGIYSVNPDGTGMRLLTSYDWAGRYSNALRYWGGYLYYQMSVYEDGEEYIALMRVSTDGGKPEEVLDRRFRPSIAHYVDGRYYYILDVNPHYDYERSLTLIDRKTGETTENVRPEGCGVNSVQIYRDETYVICAECVPETEYDTLTSVTPLRVYRFGDGEYELLAENVIRYAFSDGALWYTPFELEYYGTIQSPTGKGNETAPHDIIRNSGNTLTRVDRDGGGVMTWEFDRFGEGFTPYFYGISKGVAIVGMGSQKLYFETGDSRSEMHRYRLNDDGTVTDIGVFE